MAHAQRRQFDEAIAEFEKGFALSTRRVLMVSVLGNIHGTAGRVSEAKSILEELRDVSRRLAETPLTSVPCRVTLSPLPRRRSEPAAPSR